MIYGELRKKLGGSDAHTTNNRMELMAAIKALEALKSPCIVDLYSDSSYLVDAHLKGWLRKWQANGFVRGREKTPIPNTDLWIRLLELEAIHTVSWHKVSGHAGVAENELCDKIATHYADLARNDPSSV